MLIKFFISYAHPDKNKMEALSRAIKNTTGNYEPIIIAKRQSPAKSLEEKVISGIDEAHCIIPILTCNSITNQWVNQEIGYSKAKERLIFPIVEKSIIKKLKGFIHDKMDLPFTFEKNKSDPKKEGMNFRKCYKDLLEYLNTIKIIIVEPIFESEIKPSTVKQGEIYSTRVKFRGNVINGFFDNYVKHLESTWDTWNWDKETLKNTGHTAAGELHGIVDIERNYDWPTTNWPKGKYKIYVRLYDHLVPGKIGRIRVIEQVHDFEII